jgi:hypothetical protein
MASAISRIIKNFKCAREAAAKEREAAAAAKEAAAKEIEAAAKEAAAAAKEATAAKEAEDAKTQYMLDNAQDKGSLLDALMVIDWLRADLKCIDALLSKHKVSIDDLTPLLQHHCDKLTIANIKPINCDKLTKYNIGVSNGSLRALIFIIFKYEKSMYEVPTINDLYATLVTSDSGGKWLTDIFHALNDSINAQFIYLCETKPLSDLVQYKELHKITVTDDHIMCGIKNPDTAAFKYLAAFKTLSINLNTIPGRDRFNEKVDLEYIIKHAPDNTCMLFENDIRIACEYRQYFSYFGEIENYFECAINNEKYKVANLILKHARMSAQWKYDIPKLVMHINEKTPIENSNWEVMITYSNGEKFGIFITLSLCRHNNLRDLLYKFERNYINVEILKAVHADRYSSICTVSEDVYNANKAFLYRFILDNARYKYKLDALHVSILRELGDGKLIEAAFHRYGINFMKHYDTKLLDLVGKCCDINAFNVVSAIAAGRHYTKNDFDIGKMINKLENLEQITKILKLLGITKDDFDPIMLFNRFNKITEPSCVGGFASLIRYLKIDKVDGNKICGGCSMEFVSIVKNLFDLDTDTCAKLLCVR